MFPLRPHNNYCKDCDDKDKKIKYLESVIRVDERIIDIINNRFKSN